MSKTQAKIESILFDYETTNRNDFRGGEVKDLIFTVYKPKPRCLVARPRTLKDTHTLCHWKTATLPFSLLHKPKDIVGRDPREPWDVVKHMDIAEDSDRKKVQKTRPRLVMSPAVSVDDIEDPKVRRSLCEDAYTTDTLRAARAATSPTLTIYAPLPGHPAPANPLQLQKWLPPVVYPEWRMETINWEARQLRGDCDPTREFWVKRPKSKTDYRDGEIRDFPPTEYKKKEVCLMARPPPLKDTHTLGSWKKDPLPFRFLHRPKAILSENPYNPWHVEPFVCSESPERERVQKTRPRVVMTPAVRVDDITKTAMRRALCEDVYTTESRRAAKEAISPYFSVRAPLPGRAAPSNPITMKKWIPPYVSPEWRMETVRWENEQLRAICDSTKEFWLSRTQFKCRP